MPTLLDLSRELRNVIYIAVLDSEDFPPATPAETGDRKRMDGLCWLDEELMEFCNMYSVESIAIRSPALLLTSHRVHDELRDMLSRVERANTLKDKLDCLMVSERHIYPTWFSVPFLSSSTPHIHVDFRLFGELKGYLSGWCGGVGGPGSMIWSLFALLRRFLLRGPDFLAPLQQTRKVKIGVLVLNVVTPSEVPAEGFVRLRNRNDTTGMIHPETVVDHIETNTGYLLARSRVTASEAKLIFERVDTIKVSLDGKERKTWDLRTRVPDES